jgi:hypothetical protein
MKFTKVYLGDSVYAEWNEDYQLVLTTWNGYDDDPRNQIFLEPEVIKNLVDFIKQGIR